MDLRKRLDSIASRVQSRQAFLETAKAGGVAGVSPASEFFEGRASPAARSPAMPPGGRITGEGAGRLVCFERLVEAEFPGTMPCPRTDQLVVGASGPTLDPGVLGQLLPGAGRVEDLVFLDTETTGMSAGAGSLAFLVGVGSFQAPQSPAAPLRFRLAQLLIEDFSQEAALLEAVRREIGPGKTLCTYNGRAFDLPLLRSRCVLQRLRAPELGAPHLDLLPMARRLWREDIGPVSLKAVERRILGIDRGADIDGSLIPAVFFDFARTGAWDRMGAVVEHNAQDILSLASTYSRVAWMVADPASRLWSLPGEQAGLGKWLLASGESVRGMELIRRSLDNRRDGETRAKLGLHLAAFCKKSGRREEAVALWRELQALPMCQGFPAWEELAKHYEWVLKDRQGALRVVREALARVATEEELASYAGRAGGIPGALRDCLERRARRLERRIC